MAGIDSTGFTKKTLAEIRTSLKNKAKTKFGPTINVADDSVLGQVIDVFAEQISDIWSGAEGTYLGFNPSTAEGVPLDNVAELVGVQRLGAASSNTTAIVTGDLGTVITAGSLMSVTTTTSQFSNIAAKTLSLTDPTSAIINIDTVASATTYTVTINGTACTFTSDATATLNEITAGLAQSINFSTQQTNVTAVDNGNGTITVNSDVTITASAITNLLLQSEDLTTTWTDVGTPTVTANDTQFVDGLVTADKLEDNDGAGFEGKTQTVTITSSTDSYVVSCFLRSDTLNQARLRLQLTGGTALDGNVAVNIDTQAIVESGDVFASSGTVTLLANGWVRVSFRIDDNGTGNTSAIVEIDVGDAAADTGAIHPSGFQLERGVTTVSDYVPTATTIVTRDATTAATSLVPSPFTLAIDGNMSINKISTQLPVIATATGAIAAPIATLANIDTPIFGWDSVTNPDAATLGRDVESDTSFRQRRFESVQIAGAGTVPAIESNVRQINGVTDAFVIENRTLLVDGGGRPGKSFETIVKGGEDQAIAQKIWDVKPAGIETFGTTSKTVTDSQGNSQTINFSRPTDIWVHLEIDYTLYSEELFPTGGETTIASTAATTGATLGIGEDVILQRFFGDIYSAVSGIATIVIRQAVSATEFGVPGAFTAVNLAIGATELSNFNISRITVTQV